MSSTPFSVVGLNLGLSVTDLLQVPPPQAPLVLRQIQDLAYSAGLTCQYESYLQLSSNSLKTLFNGLQVAVVYIRNASTSGLLDLLVAFNGSSGAIGTNVLNAGGAGYAVNDTGIILAGNNDATYVIDSVSFIGAVLTYHLVVQGTGYSVATNVPTAPSGSQPGVGHGFSIDITSVSAAIAQSISLGPGGVFLFFQPNNQPGITNSISALSVASPQNQALTTVEYIFAQ